MQVKTNQENATIVVTGNKMKPSDCTIVDAAVDVVQKVIGPPRFIARDNNTQASESGFLNTESELASTCFDVLVSACCVLNDIDTGIRAALSSWQCGWIR